MIEVKKMTEREAESLLGRVNYGHLGCAADNHPYVLPIHFAYDAGTIYIYTTQGKKSQMIDANHEVCLQIEDVVDNANWASVIVVGAAKKLESEEERQRARVAVDAVNPDHAPALSYRWVDEWVRELKDDVVLYRIDRISTSGRHCGTL